MIRHESHTRFDAGENITSDIPAEALTLGGQLWLGDALCRSRATDIRTDDISFRSNVPRHFALDTIASGIIGGVVYHTS